MPDPESRPEEPIRTNARDARGAEIILKKRRSRLIFFGALAIFVLLAILLRYAG